MLGTETVPTGLTGVGRELKLTPMIKTQVYLPEEDLKALHAVAKRTGRSVAELMRTAIRAVWLRPQAKGPVALWDGEVGKTSLDHDTIYDQP